MHKRNWLTIFLGIFGLFLLTTCSKDDSGLGGCSVGCGVVGLTGYTFTEYKFISEGECRQKKEESSSSCRVVYCPPTGNEEDCVEF